MENTSDQEKAEQNIDAQNQENEENLAENKDNIENIENVEENPNQEGQIQGQNTNSEYEGDDMVIDEELKSEIMKEFRRIYGDKLDNLFVRYNMETSNDVLEMVLRNIKLARQRMKKIGLRIPENNDLKTKAMLTRLSNFLSMPPSFIPPPSADARIARVREGNLRAAERAREAQAMKTAQDVEFRKASRALREKHRKSKWAYEVYKGAIVEERTRNLERVKEEKEKRERENEEKRRKIERIEKYYTDQIEILKEELRQQKMMKEMEFKANLVLLNKLEREKKELFKKQLDDIFNKFDQEDQKEEYQFNQICEQFL